MALVDSCDSQVEYDLKSGGKHSHYKKAVINYDFIDVYRVLDLFEVTHPAVQHAAKKVLCAGQRGAKDWAKDIQEAIDSLQRALDMAKEDGSGQ